MTVIATLAQKGGVGKTTLTLHWAVEVHRRTNQPVVVLDTDTQGTAIEWRRLRKPDIPYPLVADAVRQPLKPLLTEIEAEGAAYVFIDSVPGITADIETAARLAHMVLIPCAPTMPDMSGIGATVGIVKAVGTPAALILNGGRHNSTVNGEACAYLALHYGLPVCPVHVMHRAALQDAFATGRAVVEFDPKGKAAAEIAGTWQWIEKQIGKGSHHATSSAQALAV